MGKRNLALFIIGKLIFLLAAYLYYQSFRSMIEYSNTVHTVSQVLGKLEKLSSNIKSARINVLSLHLSDSSYTVYQHDFDSVEKQLADLKAVVIYDEQKYRLDSVLILIEQNKPWIFTPDPHETYNQYDQNQRLEVLKKIQSLIDRSILFANNILTDRKLAHEHNTNITQSFFLVLLIIAASIITTTIILIYVQTRKKEKAEAFLEAVLNTSMNGIVCMRALHKKGVIYDYQITFANEAVAKQTGNKTSSLINKRLLHINPKIKMLGLIERYDNVVQTGIPVQFETFYNKNWFYVMVAKLGDGVTISFYNITDLKQYEEELNLKIRELEHTNSELEQYAYVSSHDLQEPLRKIRVFAGLIESDALDARSHLNLEKIIKSADRMSSLINKLLEYTRLQSGERKFEMTDLNQVIKNVETDFEVAIQQTHAVIQYTTLPVIEANPLQINQLFTNLLSNSLKFKKEDHPPKIKITAHYMPPEEVNKNTQLNQNLRYIKIRFTDNGIGFDQEFADHIFKIFHRLNNREKYPGVGIGLAICRKIVQQHQGDIYALSKYDIGTDFFIILPTSQTKK